MRRKNPAKVLREFEVARERFNKASDDLAQVLEQLLRKHIPTVCVVKNIKLTCFYLEASRRRQMMSIDQTIDLGSVVNEALGPAVKSPIIAFEPSSIVFVSSTEQDNIQKELRKAFCIESQNPPP